MSPAESNPNHKSTGPRTPEGKRKASHNALRHGLTARVVVMPWEDMDAYNDFCRKLMTELAPEGPIEEQYAQTFCDTQWRLNRVRSIEEGMFVLGHMEQSARIDVGHPQANNSLIAARAFRDHSNVFTNLSLYEQRLQRTLKESLRQLRELQAERKASKPAEPATDPKENEAQPETEEFVFSTPAEPAKKQPRPAVLVPETPLDREDFPFEQAA